MNRIVKLLIILFTPLFSLGQSNHLGFEMGLGQSRGDIQGTGRMFDVFVSHTFYNGVTFEIQSGIGYFEAKGQVNYLDYIHSTHYLEIKPNLGFTFHLNSINLDITPKLGFGMISFDARGEFTHPMQGQELLQTFGDAYFTAKFSPLGNRYCTSHNETALVFSQALSLSQLISPRIRVQATLMYSFLSSDGFDGYVLPVWANQHNDQFWSVKLGLKGRLGPIIIDKPSKDS
ncbi:MAG: hypothetical protein ACI9JN_001936 [Bacteroidia bacterium]|jgi:hypothetical protein